MRNSTCGRISSLCDAIGAEKRAKEAETMNAIRKLVFMAIGFAVGVGLYGLEAKGLNWISASLIAIAGLSIGLNWKEPRP